MLGNPLGFIFVFLISPAWFPRLWYMLACSFSVCFMSNLNNSLLLNRLFTTLSIFLIFCVFRWLLVGLISPVVKYLNALSVSSLSMFPSACHSCWQ